MLTNEEDTFFEILSAVAWLVAAFLFIRLFSQSVKKAGFDLKSIWFGFFFLLSVFAFGEEISWGDHLFDYSHDLEIVKINAQRETNFHNINIAQILELDEENFLYSYISNLGFVLTPLFYLVLAFFLGIAPVAKDENWLEAICIVGGNARAFKRFYGVFCYSCGGFYFH